MSNLNKIRQFKINNVIKANESLKFNDIIESEFTVKSKEENYDIPVTCYKPNNLRLDSPITIFFHGGKYFLIIVIHKRNKIPFNF